MEQKKSIWHLTALQTDFLIAEFFRAGNLEGLKDVLAEGLPLTSYILFMMRANHYSDEIIKSVITRADTVDTSGKSWIAEHLDIQDSYELYVSHPELALENFPTNEDCEKFELWDILLARGEYEIVARRSPELLVEKNTTKAYSALLAVDFDKYASLVWDKGKRGAFLSVEDGWKYLIDHGTVSILLNGVNWPAELLPQTEIIDYCLQKGLVDELYEAKRYKELLENGKFEVFVKNHSFNNMFLENYPEHVDWTDLWHHCRDKENKKYLINAALKNRTVARCQEFLLEHGNFWHKLGLLI